MADARNRNARVVTPKENYILALLMATKPGPGEGIRENHYDNMKITPKTREGNLVRPPRAESDEGLQALQRKRPGLPEGSCQLGRYRLPLSRSFG